MRASGKQPEAFLFYKGVLINYVNLLKPKANSMTQKDQQFDEAELKLLKEALKRTYKERFEVATMLYKVQQTLNKATIFHKPFFLTK